MGAVGQDGQTGAVSLCCTSRISSPLSAGRVGQPDGLGNAEYP